MSDSTVAVGYVRVSTLEQSQEGISLDVQKARIQAYAQAKNLELLEVLSDGGLSGKNLKRPGLRELMDRCERGEVQHVIVVKMDRLSRSTRHLLSLVEDLFIKRQIELHSVSESIDTGTPHGRFLLTILGGLGQMERELIGERTKGALAYKRERLEPTSHPPLGFKANGARERMVQVPKELEIVRCILDLWRRGQSYCAIARQLASEGVPTKRGGRWASETVRKVVERRAWYASVLSAV